MKKEISAGAVIYKIENNELLFLIEYMTLGHISLPKGHIEANETLLECAKREIKEETSLEVEIDSNFENVITYHPYIDHPEIIKDVHFFIGKVKSNLQKPIDKHDNEVKKSEFLPFSKAYQLLTYETDKETIQKAYNYILKKE